MIPQREMSVTITRDGQFRLSALARDILGLNPGEEGFVSVSEKGRVLELSLTEDPRACRIVWRDSSCAFNSTATIARTNLKTGKYPLECVGRVLILDVSNV